MVERRAAGVVLRVRPAVPVRLKSAPAPVSYAPGPGFHLRAGATAHPSIASAGGPRRSSNGSRNPRSLEDCPRYRNRRPAWSLTSATGPVQLRLARLDIV